MLSPSQRMTTAVFTTLGMKATGNEAIILFTVQNDRDFTIFPECSAPRPVYTQYATHQRRTIPPFPAVERLGAQ